VSTSLRLGALLASLYLVQAVLAGCGGQRGSTPTGQGTTVVSTNESPSGSGAVIFSKPHRASAAPRAERRRAANAAPFVEPGADNSVPTFGSEASAGERSAAEANLRAYLRARAAHRWAAACALLAASVRQGFAKLATSKGHAGCPKLLPVLAPLKPGEPIDPLTGALLAFRVHGANAFALFYGPGRRRYMVPMNREGGAWRPTQAAPIAYPPGAP
jgi:hypothetical protein